MSQQQQDAVRREEISTSCRLIMRHASYIGVTASELRSHPGDYEPLCMDEMNEAIGVMQRAIARIEAAKEHILSKADTNLVPA